MKTTTQLRQYLQSGKTYVAPGVFDGLSARLVERAKFDLVYASGGAIARSAGFPDVGLLSIHEILDRLTQIVEVTRLPVIADADTGYGNTLNVYRTVRLFEQTGVAALHLEDQTFPKRCGHLNDKSVISTQEMQQKIRAARDALRDPDFVIIARTDAIAVEGFDRAIERAHAYISAGADVIFIEAPESLQHIEQIAQRIAQPKLLNMFYGGKTPLVPLDHLQKLGFQIVIIPSDLQRAAIHAMQTTLDVIHQKGDSHTLTDRLVSFNERELIVDIQGFLARDRGWSEEK